MKRALSIVLAAAALCFGSVPVFARQSKPPKKEIAVLGKLSSSLQKLSTEVSRSVVQILTRGYALAPGSGEGVVTTQQGTGSGVILDTEGYIITNAHVVQGAQKIRVVIPASPSATPEVVAGSEPRSRMVPARVLGIDPDSDLSLLKIDYRGLPSLDIGDSEKLRQGQLVLACGSPLGLENSVSMGIVSSVGRQVRPDDPTIYIQTDAPINPGNSGGALVDSSGKLVGINTFILSQSGGSEGLGFAIPSDIVRNVYQQIRVNGHVHHGQIGVQPKTITPALAAGLQLPRDWGVLLEDVQPGGSADRAGLKVGDLVLTLDGRPVENALRFESAVYHHATGESITVEVTRAGDKVTATVEVTERPNDPYRFADLVTREDNLVAQLGLFALDLDASVAEQLPALRKPAAVVVAARVANASGPGELFQTGDLIDMLNGTPVLDLAGLRAALDKISSGNPVVFQIQRGSRLLFLEFEMP